MSNPSRISNFILNFPLLRTGTPNDYAHRQFGPSVAFTTERPSTPSHPLTAFTLHQTIKSRGPRPTTPGGHHHPNHKETEEVQFDYADVVVGTAEGEGTVQEEPEAEEADYLGFLDDDIEKTPTQRLVSVRLILLH